MQHLRTGRKTCVAAYQTGGIAKVSEEEVARADTFDREERQRARKEGRHPLNGPPIIRPKADE